jgi:hypothetical protein
MSNPNQGEIDQWKAQYLAMGVPETLLNTMIAEAEAEWESIIGFGDVNTMGDLTVNIIDSTFVTGEAYKIIVLIDDLVFCGALAEDITWTFSQVPCKPLIVQVYKMQVPTLPDGEEHVIGFGYATLNHASNDTLEITITIFSTGGGGIGSLQGLPIGDTLAHDFITPTLFPLSDALTFTINIEPIIACEEYLTFDITPHVVYDADVSISEVMTITIIDPSVLQISESIALTEAAVIYKTVTERIEGTTPAVKYKGASDSLIFTIT